VKVAALVPAVTANVRFSLRDRKRLPAESGCYALASFEGDILYVGLAADLSRRFCQHREDDSKRQATRGVAVTWFYYATFPKANLRRVERGWMNQYRDRHGELPPLNKVYSPVS
jgi:vacuolar-type H+-ATPase subunit B/Vma2